MPKEKIVAIPLEETCMICERVRWGDFQPCGLGKWRHKECYMGSASWLEVQRLKPEKDRSPFYPLFAK